MVLIANMEENAEVAPEIELTIENWDALFGENGRVNTPIGEVKMGEHQFAKLMRQGRNGKLGMIKPTLENPDIIIKDNSEAGEGNEAERGSSYVYVKTFAKPDGSRFYYFTSVTVSQDGMEVVVSNQEKTKKRISNLLQKNAISWINEKVQSASETQSEKSVSLDDSRTATQADNNTAPLGINSSELLDNKNTADSGISQTLGEKVSQAEAETDTNPTDGQKEAGNYKKGHVRVGAFDITIENPKGSVRSGVDANGKPWQTTMNNTYGYMRGTEGVDGDHIDVFLSDNLDNWDGQNVFVVDQYNEDGTFDEHKVMLGFNDEAEAQDAYSSNYEKGWAEKRKLVCTPVTIDEFEKWIDSSRRKTKPFAEYKGVNKEASQPIGQADTSDTAASGKENGAAPRQDSLFADTGDNAQAKQKDAAEKIEDYGEQIAGARKDLLKDLAKSMENATLQSLVSLPFSKAFKRPDLKKAFEAGALREKDVRFAEAVIASMLSEKKPKEKKILSIFGSKKSKVEQWAENAYAGIELLKALFSMPEARDVLIERATSAKTFDVEKAKERQRQLEEWNHGKTFDGTSYPINNIAVFEEAYNRLGYAPGSNADMPVAKILPDRVYGSYELFDKNGKKIYDVRPKTFEEAVDAVVYLAKVANADPSASHPGHLFAYIGKDPVYKTVGWRPVPVSAIARRNTPVFETREEADKFIREKNEKHPKKPLYSPVPTEVEEVEKYGKLEVVYFNPLTRERIATGLEYASMEEAESSFDKDRGKIDEAVNGKLAEEKAQKAGKKGVAQSLLAIWPYLSNGHLRYGIVLHEPSAEKSQYYYPLYFAEGFPTREEAEDFLEKNRSQLESQAKKSKEERQKFVYFDGDNQSRIGSDYRGGKDVTAEEFANTFGFRGVQFGNWTNQNDRQAALNNAFDAFMDLSSVLGVSPRALSLDGELGIAFGSRGTGSAAAHYEPHEVVINLTKTQGAGTLAHEWWHALDNYFARKGNIPGGFATADKKVPMREELRDAFNEIIDNVGKSDYDKRSRQKGVSYWGSIEEETARLFAEWVAAELGSRGEFNHFLSAGIGDAEERYARMNYSHYKWSKINRDEEYMSFEEFRKTPQALVKFPYPTRQELNELGKDVRRLFDTVQERIDEESGNSMLFQKTGEIVVPTAEEAALRDAIVERLRQSGLEVITDVDAGQRMIDLASGQGEQVRTQAALDGLKKASGFILSALKGTTRQRQARIEIPTRANRLAEEAIGHPIKSHIVNVNALVHIKNRHGENGTANDAASIPLKDSDIALMPYVMAAPTRVLKGSIAANGTESVRYEKELENGIVVVVEREGRFDTESMENITMWANKKSATNVTVGSKPSHSTSETIVISEADAAKIRKDAEDAIKADAKLREHRVFHGSGADFDRFDHSHMGEGEGAQAYGWGTYVTEVEGIGKVYATQKRGRISYKGHSIGEILRLYNEGVRPYNVVLSVVEKMELGYSFEEAKADLEYEWRNSLEYDEQIGNKLYAEGWKKNLSELAMLHGNDFQVNNSRLLYTVEIPDDNGSNYLEYGNPLPETLDKEAMAEAVFRRILETDEDGSYNDNTAREMLRRDLSDSFGEAEDGGTLYGTIAAYLGDRGASEFLHGLGFVGISYPAEYRNGGRKDKAKNYVIFNEDDLQIVDKARFFRTPRGEAYGFTIGGRIYIDPRIASAETPIHEYSHLWASALRHGNAGEWRNVVGLMKGTPAWEETKSRYPELATDDEIADEVLATYSGRRGAERLREQQRKIAGGRGAVVGKAEAIAALEQVKEALRRFWKAVADFLHISFSTAEEVADRVVSDLLEGVNPARGIEEQSIIDRAKAKENNNVVANDISINEEEANDLFRIVDDEKEIERLNSEPTVKVYRAMSLVDGKLYPPMSKKIGTGSNRVNQAPSEFGQWEVSDERPELVEKDGKNKNHIYIVKDNGKGLWVAYNPYFHTSRNPLNDQFAEAYQRPNLVTVEVEVPESELTSGYQAEGAKDPVGETKWNAGPVNRQLSGDKKRKVILSRWMRPVRIVPDSEVAQRIAELIEGENVVIPDNTVTPSLLEELKKLGVKIVDGINKGRKKASAMMRGGNGALDDDGLSMANDPRARLSGKPTRTARQRREFAERERRRMAERVSALAEKLHLGNVEIVTDASTLQGKRKVAKGFYSRSTGKITIVVPNHASAFDAEQTLLHEAVGHYGLRRLFGDHFDTFLNNVYQNADEDVRRRIAGLSAKHGWDFRTATEEYLASLAEETDFENVNAGWWQKIKAFFLDMLHKIGFEGFTGVTLSDNELRYLLWRSYENLAEPGRYRGILEEAADIVKQDELKVGNYAPREMNAQRAAESADMGLEEANRRFNEELQKWHNGEMGANDYIMAGHPTGVLKQFMPNKPIILRQKVLSKSHKKHKLSIADIQNMPLALSEPIFVFKSSNNTISVLTELKNSNEKNIFVAIELGAAKQMGHRFLEVNDILTIHGREVENIVTPIVENNSLVWADKEKGLNWLSSAKSNSQAIANEILSTAANIVKNFENPAEKGDFLYRDGEDVDLGLADRYQKRVTSKAGEAAEAYQDNMRSVRILQEEIAKETGRPIADFENAYDRENHENSINKIEQEQYIRDIMKPTEKVLTKIQLRKWENKEFITFDEIEKYLIAKHGLERNVSIGSPQRYPMFSRK